MCIWWRWGVYKRLNAMKITLDTNCIISLDTNTEDSHDIRQIIGLHKKCRDQNSSQSLKVLSNALIHVMVNSMN